MNLSAKKKTHIKNKGDYYKNNIKIRESIWLMNASGDFWFTKIGHHSFSADHSLAWTKLEIIYAHYET